MSKIQALKERAADYNALNAAAAVMDWDQQTYMPAGGAEARAEHLGILSRMSHDIISSDEMARLLQDAAASVDPDSEDGATVRVLRRAHDQAVKVPAALVEERTRLASIAHEQWVKARKANDFASFADTLAKMFDLTRQTAEHLGCTEHIYDALLDLYEEGATTADARAMFDAVKGPQVELVRAIGASGTVPQDKGLYGSWDREKQRLFTEEMVQAIGFDFKNGRQDIAAHPFCTNFSVGDVRLTTRYQDYIGAAIFGSLHEAGHGMYEQGSPMAWDRTPLAGGVSMAVHESQSRTWENIVGRSRAFWVRFLPRLQSFFPELTSYDIDSWHLAVNKVKPSLIRVEADECTYNLHILVRFELECALMEGSLAVKDLPDAWNAKYQEYLGITPDSDADGCLQDVHWSAGLVGYFPTYSMGNLLSWQIWNALERDLGDAETLIEKGDFASILGWLQVNVYRAGKRWTPKDLVQKVTGKPMGAEDYLAALDKKYRALYSL